MDEVIQNTPKVIEKYLKVINTGSEDGYERQLPLKEVYEDPNFKYFRSVKHQNHYALHKNDVLVSREEKKKIAPSNCINFDPFNRTQLLERLQTYKPSNWNSSFWASKNNFNELDCACHGWVCVDVSQNSSKKNHLVCVSCKRHLFFHFNEYDTVSNILPRTFSQEDVSVLNEKLIEEYKKQIRSCGHDSSCFWANLGTPKDRIYYVLPCDKSGEDILINNFLQTLESYSNMAPEFYQMLRNVELSSSVKNYDFEEDIFASNALSLLKSRQKMLHINSGIQIFKNILILLCATQSWKYSEVHNDTNTRAYLQCQNCNSYLQFKEYEEIQLTDPVNSRTSFIDFFDKEHADLDTFAGLECKHKDWCYTLKPYSEYEAIWLYTIELIINASLDRSNKRSLIEEDVLASPISLEKRPQGADYLKNLEKFQKLRKFYLEEQK